MRVPGDHCGTYPSESVGICVDVFQVHFCWRALFSDRARLGAQAALILPSAKEITSITVHLRWTFPSRLTTISAQFSRLTSRLVVSAREVFEVLRLRQMRKHRCL